MPDVQSGTTTVFARGPYAGWLVVAGSLLALTVSNAPVVLYSFGILLVPITAEFGWTRGEASLALAFHVACLGLSSPFVGRLMDRMGPRRVLIPAVILVGAGLASLSMLGASHALFYVSFAVLGCISAALTPPPYTRAVVAWFDRRRGLALGISTAGVGLGIAFVPPIVQQLVATQGWRGAFVGLGVLTIAALPILLFLIREPRSGEFSDSAPGARPSGTTAGYSLRQALRRREFWILTVAFVLSAAAVTGTAVHLVPLLVDSGIQASKAAAIASVLGLSLLGGRVASGWLMDRFFAPYVASFFLALACVGMLLLSMHHPTVASIVVATALVGAGIGAEIDVMAYLASRYFGLRSFTEIAGWLFVAYVVGTSVGPALMGWTFDHRDTYAPALYGFAGATALSIVLFLRLGGYPNEFPANSIESGP